MFSIKELQHILLGIIILCFVVNVGAVMHNSTSNYFLAISLFSIILVVFINLFAKKITAYYLDSKIETKIWMAERFGFKPHQHLKKPIPAGIFIPFLISIISLGYAMWFAIFEFDVKPATSRATKKHDIYKFTEMTDFHLALIASSGLVLNLIAAIIGYLVGFPEFTKISIYYAAFSLLPLSNLDGTKIFFGSRTLWFALAVITGVFIGYSVFLP